MLISCAVNAYTKLRFSNDATQLLFGLGSKLQSCLSEFRLIANSNTTINVRHYENMPMQYTEIFHGCINDNFELKYFD